MMGNFRIKQSKKFFIDCILNLIKAFVSIYDFITLPFYYYIQRIRALKEKAECFKSHQIHPTDPSSPWQQVNLEPTFDLTRANINYFCTYDQMLERSCKIYADRPCYGYREILEEKIIKNQDTGKVLKQVRLDEYKWVTFAEFNEQIKAALKGFLLHGIKSGDTVMIFADTRPEWQIASQALLRMNVTVSTMYSTLGADGIVHSINETKVTYIVTQDNIIDKLFRLKDRITTLKTIIYFEPYYSRNVRSLEPNGQKLATDVSTPKQSGGNLTNERLESDGINRAIVFNLKCISFSDLLHKGRTIEEEKVPPYERPQKDNVAMIMYTSGSTGVPKGVVITHSNLLATVESFTYSNRDYIYDDPTTTNHTVAAYLPLAHIFEFSTEAMLLFHGVKLGFASPNTLTNKSPGLISGETGDLIILKPTIMIIVPLILDRMHLGIKDMLHNEGYFKEHLLGWLIKYKMYWMKYYYKTPLIDRFVCKKLSKAILGGRCRYIICGSAPLNSKTQQFLRAALNVKLAQGYGATESLGPVSCQAFDDESTDNVGLPLANVLVKLDSWHEGNYHPTDRPYPRGEIVIGGGIITQGYYNLEEQTKQAFYTDNKGTRWYRTGDIGLMLANGQLRIIDRKNDLVKLQNGEYISLGRVEASLKSNKYLENLCVYANPAFNFIVALGPVNESALIGLGNEIILKNVDTNHHSDRDGKSNDNDKLCDHNLEALEELEDIMVAYRYNKTRGINMNMVATNKSPNSRETHDETKSSKTSQQNIIIHNNLLNRLCNNKLIENAVYESILTKAKDSHLPRLEIPKRVVLLPDEWTAEIGLVTAAMKIRRALIYKYYQSRLNDLYKEANQ